MKEIMIIATLAGMLFISMNTQAASDELKSTQLMDFSSQDSADRTPEIPVPAAAPSPRAVAAPMAPGAARSAPLADQNPLKRKMILFDFKDDLECPIFSNSPYTDALDAIEKMQTQINKVFPPCDNQDKTGELTEASQKFRDRIAQAQQLQKSGLTTQFNKVVKDALLSANQLQTLLNEAVQAPVSVCAKSNQKERKNVIFQINDTFQSLAPVILDLVSQNPALKASVAPYMKILVGAEGISKNISMIESLMLESEMFDMTISENRKNTVKNVCQFMKLYRRLKYMRQSRLEDTLKITSDYEQKISKMKQKLENIQTENSQMSKLAARGIVAQAPLPVGSATTGQGGGPGLYRPMHANMAMQASTDSNYDAFVQLNDDAKGGAFSKNLIRSTIQFVDDVKTQLANPEISQCQIILKEINRKEHKTNLAALGKLANYYNESLVDRFATSAEAYLDNMNRLDLKNRTDLKDCVVLGMDWLTSVLQAFELTEALVKKFEDQLIAENGAKYFKNHRQIKKTNRDIENKKSELAKIQTMIDVASFESSEVEKNARGLYRFFLNGPRWDEITSESSIKKISTWLVNKGPVYSLLKNTESNFLDAVDQVTVSLGRIQTFERQWALRAYGNKIPADMKKFNEWRKLETQYIRDLPHLTPENFPKGTARHQLVCNNAALTIDYYIQATTHLYSSENLCLMIKPAIIEEEVSPGLRAYCEVTAGSRWTNSTKDRPSDIDQMMAKMVGGEASIRSVVAHLLEKLQNLSCE